jgi:hypothetical protein
MVKRWRGLRFEGEARVKEYAKSLKWLWEVNVLGAICFTKTVLMEDLSKTWFKKGLHARFLPCLARMRFFCFLGRENSGVDIFLA